MKNGLAVLLVLALLGWGNALAQTDPQPPAPGSAMTELAAHIEGIGKLLEGENKLTKEQVDLLLPYLRAIRSSAALTPVMAEWYVQQIQAQLTPEQRAAIQPAEATPESANQTTQTGNTSSDSSQNQTNTESSTQTEQTPALALDLNAPNPFAQEPAATRLDEIIARLTQISQA
ncbi:hypothetical protein [Meiothermus hypogaeus]|uniref:Uncharacterized protein n=2 Tax=Meiothermus hypogaeus TaxID=884155 RepID=A0A511R375_9DEIN|nr:hypothetical protein [Meiothermus hypogaeus]RIH77222.1 hypothetical protein Mhypo_02119 [Meiothermus hypogaeus]GEM84059.1 hypothetical protein MHY01S_22250 [Meiothermus hypogaeus NBRC 106114]GIW37201.1 MAG: hypothetical protein KatS3mg073_1346 [Meiothermus sp.]